MAVLAAMKIPPLMLRAALALMLVSWVFGGFALRGQTNLETNAGVQFNFSTPGAGNLALGGAFLALAFDASAAYTNPAGLTLIAEPEGLLEARHWRYTHAFTDHGRIAGPDQTPTGMGNDTIAGLRDGEAHDQLTGLSYLGYVHPYRNWSLALYRHELVDFDANFAAHGAYLNRNRSTDPNGIPGADDGRLAALRNTMSLKVVDYGGAAAYRLGHGLSLGLSVSYYDFSIDSTADRYLPEFGDPPDFSKDPLVNFQTQRGKDNDWGYAAGFLWQSRQGRWSLGGVYRQGPDFTFQATSSPGPGAIAPFVASSQRTPFHVPDVYGLGLGFRPRESLRFALDYDHVSYSQLTHGFVDIFNLSKLTPSDPEAPEIKPTDPELDKFRIDDANEVHLGAEYAFLQHWPVVILRAGAWYDPDHSLRFEGQNVGFRAVFRRRGDQMHYTAGTGLVLRRLQVDAAIDYSQRISVVSVSTGFRF
jgi:long-chain fatty acid transport protein